jgi:hypothetical protein
MAREEESVTVAEQIAGMGSPVRCTGCDKIYDLQAVHVIGHFVDCSVWNCPHCKRQADSRQGKSLPDYRPLDRRALDVFGKPRWF